MARQEKAVHPARLDCRPTPGRLLAVAVALVVVGVVSFYVGQASAGGGLGSSAPVAVGQTAPDAALPGLDGGTVRLSDYRGKVVLLNFWATWCPPCQAEMPGLEQVYQARQKDGLVILGLDQQEAKSAVQSFVSQHGYTWTFALDQDGAVAQRYGVSGYPTSVIVDRDGKVAYVHVGALSAGTLESELATLGVGQP